MRSTLFLVSLGLLTACSTVNYIGIDTYNPAEITFPENITKILMVNNAVPQPHDRGYELTVSGLPQDTARVQTDSALFDACRSLGTAIVDAGYFKDVLLYDKPLRTDTVYYEDRKIPSAEIRLLCEENEADAVVALDRLLFDMERNEAELPKGYVMGTIDVKMAAVFRAYLPGREAPLATIYVADSLFWTEAAPNLRTLGKILPAPEEAVRTAGQYLALKASPNFVPHWENETRWYFTGVSSAWKEASAYAAAEKWETAAERWQQLYAASSGWKPKARAASNLALAEEMKGDMQKAQEWASRSHALFLQYSGEKDKYTQLLKIYADVLSERVRNDQKLNIQIGKE